MTAADSLTNGQGQIASAVRRAFTAAGVEFVESIDFVEPVLIIRPVLSPALKLDVAVHIGCDLFAVIANGADLRLAVQDAKLDETAWVRMCIQTIDALVSEDLRIRVRRTLFGGTTGAIWVPVNGGAWNGEFLAHLGLGREKVYPWMRKP